jgi:pyruvate-formate lyase-activating enzyme
MYRAVHADRAGRVVLTDHGALGFDGTRAVPLTDAIPVPSDAPVIPIEREALAAQRSGKPRPLGAGRLAAAALLPPGHLRTLLPAYVDAAERADLVPRPYAAVAADEDGRLVVAGMVLDRDPTHDAASYPRNDIGTRVNDALRAEPGDRLVRQLARCAREYACHGAANAFYGRWECALPVGAPPNEDPPAPVAPRRDGEADPREPAVFRPSAEEIARLAVAHVAAGGTILSFGRACEGEPLLSARVIEDAIGRVRTATRGGTVHLETNGSSTQALRRLAAAGLDSITVRIASALPATYDALHGPRDYRVQDVRSTLRLAAELGLSISLLVLVLPGIFDRSDEQEALVGLAMELPEGSTLLLRDLHADPLRALALVPSADAPMGVAQAVLRLRERLPHLRVGSFVRPLART